MAVLFFVSDVPVSQIPNTGESNSLALELNSNDTVQYNSIFPFHEPGDATLEFWLKYTPRAHQSVFWSRIGNTDRNRFNIFVNRNGTFGFDYRSPSGSLHRLVGSGSSGIDIEPNSWTHLAIVRTDNVYDLYRNGELVVSATDNNPNLPNSVGWEIAGRSGFSYDGLIDEIRFSNRALSSSEFLNYNIIDTADVQDSLLVGEKILNPENFVNDSLLNPGNQIGTLNLKSNYTQTATGVLNLELSGTNIGEFDQLAISNTADLRGIPNVSLLNGYTPQSEDSFDIITFGSRLGDFNTANLPTLADDLSWQS